jgi:hypothetical protein
MRKLYSTRTRNFLCRSSDKSSLANPIQFCIAIPVMDVVVNEGGEEIASDDEDYASDLFDDDALIYPNFAAPCYGAGSEYAKGDGATG